MSQSSPLVSPTNANHWSDTPAESPILQGLIAVTPPMLPMLKSDCLALRALAQNDGILTQCFYCQNLENRISFRIICFPLPNSSRFIRYNKQIPRGRMILFHVLRRNT